MAQKIEDYGLIGDCEAVALVARDGSIDWLCWPRFDSGACFAALLGRPEKGHWLLSPVEQAKSISRRYRRNTLVLETTIETVDGAVTLVDFMPVREAASHVVRLITGSRGQVAMHTELIIRFDYDSLLPFVSQDDDGTWLAVSGPDMIVLRSPLQLHHEHHRIAGEFTVSAGQVILLILTYGPSHLAPPKRNDPMKALADTEAFWERWSRRFIGPGKLTEPVLRSLVTLKALTYRRTGGIVAAPTTSLPEQLGGSRNWDYRFCWLRDSTFTLLALMNSGYYDEANAWHKWLSRAAAGDPSQAQIMYGLSGEHRLTEWEVPWLAGYEASKPVRIGNAAAEQTQLDIYGEVMDALHHGRRGKLMTDKIGWTLQQEFLQHLETIWKDPDEGIWEVRGGPKQFTYSKIMAWVAFDRAIKAVEHFGLEGPVSRWRAIREKIHKDVCAKGFNSEIGSFVQYYGSSDLDASILLLPLVGFLPPRDPRVHSIIEAIKHHLAVDGLVVRYDTSTKHD
ncbi:MAG: glycoside hydrolase family 15 protein [Gammaproteobacteria bacterium]